MVFKHHLWNISLDEVFLSILAAFLFFVLLTIVSKWSLASSTCTLVVFLSILDLWVSCLYLMNLALWFFNTASYLSLFDTRLAYPCLLPSCVDVAIYKILFWNVLYPSVENPAISMCLTLPAMMAL